MNKETQAIDNDMGQLAEDARNLMAVTADVAGEKVVEARKRLAAALDAKGLITLTTREPGGSPGAEEIRALLVNGAPGRWDALTETLLVYAARADHVGRTIGPALLADKWVISDRFTDSTYAYQGAGRGLDQEFIKLINDYSSMLLKPDLTLLFDLPVEIGLQRATERNNCLKESSSIDRFERENMDFHRRIREGYLNILKNEPNRFRLIDATRDVDTIQEEVRRYIVDFINLQN